MRRTKLDENLQRGRILPTSYEHDQGVERSNDFKYLVHTANTNSLMKPVGLLNQPRFAPDSRSPVVK